MESQSEKPRLEPPKVAIIVASYNAVEILPRCLEGILEQDPDQVIVVNDGSTDSTEEFLESLQKVTAINLEGNAGVGNARNRGLEAVDKDIDFIAFIDSDIVLDERWLDTLLAEVDWETYSAACGRIRAADDGRHWAATLDEAQTSRRFGSEPHELDPPWREVMYFNYLFKAEIFEEVGEFDPRFRTNAEDSDYFFRCAEKGFRFYYQPKASGLHCYPRPTFWGWLKRSFRNGFYTIQFHKTNRTPLWSLKVLKSIALALSLVVLIALPLVTGDPRIIAGYAILFLVAGLLKSLQLGFRPLLGGWILILGWLAKAFGEMRGILRG